jgi:hypothetical protein
MFLRDHRGHRERSAALPLTLGAVAGIHNGGRRGDLIADRATLAAAGLRELHRAMILFGLPG